MCIRDSSPGECIEGHLSGQDPFPNLRVRGAPFQVERVYPAEEDVQHHTERPHVRRRPEGLPSEDLGGAVYTYTKKHTTKGTRGVQLITRKMRRVVYIVDTFDKK